MISELFTNAVTHGPAGGQVLVGYWLWPAGVRLIVCDGGGATTPRLCQPGELAEIGRGLHVVDAVAAAWGCFRAGNAQAVWCDIGEPLDEAASYAWAWLLLPVLAATSLSANRSQATAAGTWPARGSLGNSGMCGATVTVARALPRRIRDLSLVAATATTASPRTDPEILHRVLDALNRL